MKQLDLEFPTWGGKRVGAGRKRAPANVGLLKHEARDPVDARNPVHVTMRALRGVPRMRSDVVAAVVIAEIARASAKGLGVLHFSVQDDHVHLIVEAKDGTALSRGIQRVASRIAMGVNALAKRRGQFWRERYHRRDLASPRQFRNALVYVTFNYRKHATPSQRSERARAVDLRSSAIWFDDWADPKIVEKVRAARAGPSPVVAPRTWFARTGWKHCGCLRLEEMPRLPA